MTISEEGGITDENRSRKKSEAFVWNIQDNFQNKA